MLSDKVRNYSGFVQGEYLECVEGKCTMEAGRVEGLGQRKPLMSGNSIQLPA